MKHLWKQVETHGAGMWILSEIGKPPDAVLRQAGVDRSWLVIVYVAANSFDEIGRDTFQDVDEAKAWATALVATR